MEKDYGIKGATITLKSNDKSFDMDYVNEVHIQKYNKTSFLNKVKDNNLIFVFSEIFNDDVDEFIDKKFSMTINRQCRDMDNKDFVDMESFDNMRLLYYTTIYNFNSPSEIIYVFSDDSQCKSNNYKKEIQNILDRREKDSNFNRIILTMEAINERNIRENKLSILNYNEMISNILKSYSKENNEKILNQKELYFDLGRVEDNLFECNVLYNKTIYRYINNNLEYIAECIEKIIGDKDVVIYGDYFGLGLCLSDLLKSKGLKTSDTRIVVQNIKNYKTIDRVSKCN